MGARKKDLTPSERRKLEQIKTEALSAERVAAIVGTADVAAAGKLLGGPVSAARQRRGARVTGHKEEDIYKVHGGHAGKFMTKRGKL